MLAGDAIDDDALRGYAEGLVSRRGADAVSVRVAPDGSVAYARVVEVLDLLAAAGVTDFALAP